jgi:hypothetical protein
MTGSMTGGRKHEEIQASASAAKEEKRSHGVLVHRLVKPFGSASTSANPTNHIQFHKLEQHLADVRNNLKGLGYAW